MAKRHVNIPIFIPHLGCPNACVFCNQHKISGKDAFVLERATEELKQVFSTIDSSVTEAEIAFFGGSFTGIDRELMRSLLDLAETYVQEGKATAIRLSTRPDYIDDSVLQILRSYSVKTIELGIQSCKDAVLDASKRGHTFADAVRACTLIKEYGFSLVGQMMIGLPKSDLTDELATAEFISQHANAARVYPTVVFRDTVLCRMAETGEYVPLDVESAVERTAAVFEVFLANSVPVIRIGLHASERLTDENEVYGGANHPALGELVMSRVYLQRMRSALQNSPEKIGKTVTFAVAKGATSKALGQHGENREKLCREFQIKSVKIVEKSEELLYNVILV